MADVGGDDRGGDDTQAGLIEETGLSEGQLLARRKERKKRRQERLIKGQI